MVSLVIDEGNTQSKYGVFQDQELLKVGVINDLQDLEVLFEEFKPEKGILSSVKDPIHGLDSKLIPIDFHMMTSQTPIPIKLDYETPDTLGIDRIVAAVGGFSEFPDHNLLVVDLGTCITADLVIEGRFLGGWILPGINMQFQAMHSGTGNLPLLEIKDPEKVGVFGKSTQGSMKSGVIKSVNMAVDGFFSNCKREFGNMLMVVTGGDSNQLETNPKESIFARPNLILKGLNRILLFNEEVS